ncbi:FMN-binding negative transcriptional regulator [Sphingomonas morindae]|uniref:FMN-binding negative transcriptional regulator n=1 Tax=Sphingomonas morindae TaxID=1541170 RepID=A0ABY4X826_9SPHN|nr:FMN-binding negative transcriptional regulator [Sphingomonas morindae]USI73059.1 FMN-binding negative transcriptional regulator [Sphingomonas morindae]
MYRPPAFRETHPERLHAAIRAHPLATLVSHGAAGLTANLIPFTLHGEGAAAVLRAHLARANDQLADLRQSAPVLVIFQGPQAYVSPGWYPTKAEHGKVVPTWNYIMVQVRGTPRVIDCPVWLRAQIDQLTDAQEGGRARPWRLEDAPDGFVAAQMGGIVGLEIPVSHIEGKWKLSQNQPERNRIGVEQGLRADGRADMAEMMAARRAPD